MRLKAFKKKSCYAHLRLQSVLRFQKGLPVDQETHQKDAIRLPAESPLDAILVGEIVVLAGTELEIQNILYLAGRITNFELYKEVTVVKAKVGKTQKIVANRKALKHRKVNHATRQKAGAQEIAQNPAIALNLVNAPNRVQEIIRRTLLSTKRNRSDHQQR